MKKIILEGHIEVPEIEIEQILQALPVHIELTLKEVGCITFQVQQDENKSSIFHVYEEFIDEAAFQSHQDRVKNSNWGHITKNIKRFYTISKK